MDSGTPRDNRLGKATAGIPDFLDMPLTATITTLAPPGTVKAGIPNFLDRLFEKIFFKVDSVAEKRLRFCCLSSSLSCH